MIDRAEVLVVNPHLQVIRCSDDEVIVKHGIRSLFSEVITDEGRTKLMGRVLDRLNRPGSLADLLGEDVIGKDEAEPAGTLLDYLSVRKVLIQPDQDLALAYLDTLMANDGPATRTLGQARIGLVGAGFLGARVARQLAGFTPKELVLLDRRSVEDTREGRLFGFNQSTVAVGRPYVELLQQQLTADGFTAASARAQSMSDEASLVALFEATDFVICALESFAPATLHAVNAASIRQRKPWMSIFVDGSQATVGPTYVPGETSCYLEFEIQSEASHTRQDEYLLYKEHLQANGHASVRPVLPSYSEVAASLGAISTLRFLLSGTAFTVGRAVHVDFERMSFDYQDVLRVPRCPACNGVRAAYRHTFL
ncbi:MAG: TOMM precursor leader peptide-binding protein [Candidatus Dormibacteraeota bacterium]|nr:TOMM precursor leader peptide-binding protein [Candidatus Dormibacteraeota bacterium]